MSIQEKDLDSLKQDYALLEKKYSLPSFDFLNREFEIEELCQRKTDFVLRGVRKSMIEKALSFSKLIELILNPSEGNSLFIFSISKKISQESKKELTKIYESLSEFYLQSIKMDLIYSEEEEIKFILRLSSFWKDAKKIIFSSLETINLNKNDSNRKGEKSYFR